MTRMRLVPFFAASVVWAFATGTAEAAFLGPTPYLSFADSPFNGQSFTYFHLDTFEAGALTAPGVTATPGWTVLAPSTFTDSVDADDGVIDGSGAGGHSFFSNSTNSTLTFTFDAAALGGHLPTSAGIVWTDVGNVTSGTTGIGSVRFSATDSGGISLGSIGPFTLGNGSALGNSAGATVEDRFFGVVNPGGISSITISMDNSSDWEVDHLQFGFQAPSTPEPSSLVLLALGGVAFVWRCRFRAARMVR